MSNPYRISEGWGVHPITEADRGGILAATREVVPFNTDLSPLPRAEGQDAGKADADREHITRSLADQRLLERATPRTSMLTELTMGLVRSERTEKGIAPDQPVRQEELEMVKMLARAISPEADYAFEQEIMEVTLRDGVTRLRYEENKRIFEIDNTSSIAEATLAMVGLAAKSGPRYYWYSPVPGEKRAELISVIIKANMNLGPYGASPEYNPLEKNVYRPAFEQGILAARDAGRINQQTPLEEITRIGHEAGQEALRQLAEEVALPLFPERLHHEYRQASELNIEPFYSRDDPRFQKWVSNVLEDMATDPRLEGRALKAVDLECKWDVTQDKTFRVIPDEFVRVRDENGDVSFASSVHSMAALHNENEYYDGTLIGAGRVTYRIFPPSSPGEKPYMTLVEFNTDSGHFKATEGVMTSIEAGIAHGWFSEAEIEAARLRIPIPVYGRLEASDLDPENLDQKNLDEMRRRKRPHTGPGMTEFID